MDNFDFAPGRYRSWVDQTATFPRPAAAAAQRHASLRNCVTATRAQALEFAEATTPMSTLHRFEPGSFDFLEGGFPYSAGVVARPGFEIRRVRFSDVLPVAAGFARIADILRAEGRPATALCAAELRSPQPFTMAGFKDFNRDYVDVLTAWGLVRGGLNPVARSNVCPLHGPPAEPGFHAFCYTVQAGDSSAGASASSSPLPPAAQASTFVVAGSGEWPEHLPFPAGIVARGDVSPAGMAAKIGYVLQTMRSRCEGLGADWHGVSGAHIYTGHDIHPFLGNHFAASGLLRNGLDWQVCAPPILELEFEMDVRRIRHETLA